MGGFFRNDERARDGLGDPSETAVRVRVPVVRAGGESLEAVAATLVQLLSALSRSWEPAHLRFVISAGGACQPGAEWQVDAADAQTALSVATNLATIANAVLADIRVGEPQHAEPTSGVDAVAEPAEVVVADFVASISTRGIHSACRFRFLRSVPGMTTPRNQWRPICRVSEPRLEVELPVEGSMWQS